MRHAPLDALLLVLVAVAPFGCAGEDSDGSSSSGGYGESEETGGGDEVPSGCQNGICERGESCDPDFGSRDMCTTDCATMYESFEVQGEACLLALDDLVGCLYTEGCNQWADYWAGGTDHMCVEFDANLRAACDDVSAWDDWK